MFDLNFPDNRIPILILILWEVFWKGIGLWKSAKRGDIWWFIPILLVNFFGLIPILYLWRTKQLKEVVNDTLRFLRIRKS